MERGEEEEEREGRVERKRKNRNEEKSAPLPEMGFPGSSKGKEFACNVGDPASIPGSERSPAEANGYTCQNSCLENSMDRGAWQATVRGVAESQPRLNNEQFHLPSLKYSSELA